MPEIETRYGRLAVPDPATDLIARFLLRYGEWAQDEIRFVASALRQASPRVCDIGAFVGTFGIGLAQAVPLGGLVFAEVNPELLPLLERNARLAPGIEPVVVGAAVGRAETLGAASYDPSNLGSLSFATPAGNGRVEAAVSPRQVTLAELRRDYGPFDIIKIDAEGLERDILLSDPDGLREATCSYWLECNEAAESLTLCEALLSAGFRIQYFAHPAHSPTNYLGDAEPIFPFAYEAGLWATRGQPAALDPRLAEEGCMLVPIVSPEDLRLALWRTPRFGHSAWVGEPAPVIAALAGRELRGDLYEAFPAADPPLVPVAALRARLIELEAALGQSHADAQERALAAEDLRRAADAELVVLRVRLQQAEAQAARSQAAAEILVADAQERALAAEDLRRGAEAELVLLRARLQQVEAQASRSQASAEILVADAQERALAAEDSRRAAEASAAAITGSTTWRLTGAIRTRLATRPRVVSATKAVLRPAWRVARAIFGNRQP